MENQQTPDIYKNVEVLHASRTEAGARDNMKWDASCRVQLRHDTAPVIGEKEMGTRVSSEKLPYDTFETIKANGLGWYKGGFVISPNRDGQTVLKLVSLGQFVGKELPVSEFNGKANGAAKPEKALA